MIWLNGCFGVGKSAVAGALCRAIPGAFLFDPEQVGAFLWENFPPPMRRQGDFQDLPLWRSITFEMLRYLSREYAGPLIVPMTVASAQYRSEIFGRLEAEGIRVRAFLLTAPRETVLARLRGRGEEPGCWAERQLDRCLAAFARGGFGEPLDAEVLTPEELAGQIAAVCGLRG